MNMMTEVVDSLNCCNFVRGNNITYKNLLGLVCQASVSTVPSFFVSCQKYFSLTRWESWSTFILENCRNSSICKNVNSFRNSIHRGLEN